MEKITLQELLKKEVWLIDVKSWGRMLFIGNEEEAEDMRRHKANWEQSVATKERLSLAMNNMIISDDSGTTSLDNFIYRFLTPPKTVVDDKSEGGK